MLCDLARLVHSVSFRTCAVVSKQTILIVRKISHLLTNFPSFSNRQKMKLSLVTLFVFFSFLGFNPVSSANADFQCYVCFPDGINLQKCNEPQESQLKPCPARPDGSQVCWMTMKEDADKSLIVSRGCGRAMEAPQLRNDECKKNKDRASGVTEQICNCSTSKCNKNNCRSKSKCFL